MPPQDSPPPPQEQQHTPSITTTTSTSNPRLAALAARKSTLEATLATLLADRAALIAQASPSTDQTPTDDEALTAAQARIKHHIATLHRYNQVKDVGQGLMGLVAEARGMRVKDVMEDFGLEAGD